MKLKYLSFSKLVLIAFLCLGCLKLHSNNFQIKNHLKEIKKIKKIKDQFLYFHGNIYAPQNNVEDLDEWVIYLKKEKKKYKL